MLNPAEQEVQLSIDFACYHCGKPVGVTVQCSSEEFTLGKDDSTAIAPRIVVSMTIRKLR